MSDSTLTEVKNCAIGLLARREHSQFELRHKLKLRQFDSILIEQTLQQLTHEGLQSDARFAEIYSRIRANKGYGPVRIQVELHQRGISHELIANFLDSMGDFWLDNVAQVYRKKFGTKVARSMQERAKQMRFLQYRGFTSEQIRTVFCDE